MFVRDCDLALKPSRAAMGFSHVRSLQETPFSHGQPAKEWSRRIEPVRPARGGSAAGNRGQWRGARGSAAGRAASAGSAAGPRRPPTRRRTRRRRPSRRHAIAQIHGWVMTALRDERGIHCETALTVVGALGGYAAQQAIWEGMVKPPDHQGKAFMVVARPRRRVLFRRVHQPGAGVHAEYRVLLEPVAAARDPPAPSSFRTSSRSSSIPQRR